METILVTGGAGFIGSHLVDALLAAGYRVRVIDALLPQVHGPDPQPHNLSADAEFWPGDVRDRALLARALQGVDVVFHLAAEVGVGQSMYAIERYIGANTAATATLLDLLAAGGTQVRKLIVASSMSIYGEGAYHCASHGLIEPELRPASQLAAHDWEMRCPQCGQPVQPLPTNERKRLYPTSIYAVSKMDQELMCLMVGRAYGLPTVALRYFNVYGERQSLSNPYTGIAAIFGSRLLNGRPPLIFEDGRQLRDFTHVSDIVRANLLAMQREEADFQAINIGTGRALSVHNVATTLARLLNVSIEPEIVERFREGDIRHCYADISLARRVLGYAPSISFEAGMARLVEWMHNQLAVDTLDQARYELEQRRLTR